MDPGLQQRCRAINSGLKSLRAPHMARSTIVGNLRASERQGSSDVQTPSPMQSMTGYRAQLPRTGLRHANNNVATDSDKAATDDSKDCSRSGTPESRSCESRWLPCGPRDRLRHRQERRHRLHQILNDHFLPRSPQIHYLTEIFIVECGTSRRPSKCHEGHFPRVHHSPELSGTWL